ncbi:MAG: gamma carbonic anhydrase family protein [Rhodobacteraceae bacterium]|nr:gamma carbonic anhydrase family protein [Paracoccaceae bacterium]
MSIYSLGDLRPEIAEDAWVAPGAQVIGDVVLEAGSSIWFGAVLRGDTEPIRVGAGSNIQENSVLHADPGFPVTVGAGCTVGHKAIVHGCTIGEGSLIGMGATILNGAKIGKNCLIGAGALVTEGKEIPNGSLVMGVPAKVVRPLDDKAIAGLKQSARHYAQNAARFRGELQLRG